MDIQKLPNAVQNGKSRNSGQVMFNDSRHEGHVQFYTRYIHAAREWESGIILRLDVSRLLVLLFTHHSQ